MSLSRSARYPQGACTQFAAFYDSTAGLYLAALDPEQARDWAVLFRCGYWYGRREP